jgi:hypothetical protein
MSDGAIRKDVIAALKAQPGVVATELADGSVEVSGTNGNLRRHVFGQTVSRTMLGKLERWYGVPMAAFYPSTSVRPQSNASGE